MELNCAHVVYVARERKEAALELVVPHLDLVVIAAADKQWLRFVKVNAAHGACKKERVNLNERSKAHLHALRTCRGVRRLGSRKG